MKTEEEIKQAAREYAELDIEIEAGYVLAARNAFIAGANFGRELGMRDAFEWRDCFDNPPLPKSADYLIVCKDNRGNSALEYIHDQEDCDDLHKYWNEWKPVELEDMP